jgi:hypothetical protein
MKYITKKLFNTSEKSVNARKAGKDVIRGKSGDPIVGARCPCPLNKRVFCRVALTYEMIVDFPVRMLCNCIYIQGILYAIKKGAGNILLPLELKIL